jgi:hypothetical protein
MKHTTRGIAAFALATCLTAPLAMSASSPATASGGGDDRVIKTGSCSDGARWKLKVKSDDGRLEVEAEVDSNQQGQSWNWRIRDNGTAAAKGSAMTVGASGSFSVERRIADRPGTDNVVFRAKRPATGEVCRGAISFG